MLLCLFLNSRLRYVFIFFFFNDTATTEIYTLSLHDALPILSADGYQQVITHVFVAGDPYLDSDAVFAVKESLIGERSEEHTSELQSPCNLVCRLLLEKKKQNRGRYTCIRCSQYRSMKVYSTF